MKRLARIFAAWIAISFPICGHADPSIHQVAIGGSGREPCSAWTKDRIATSADARLASQSRIDWISGYFSAVNMFAEASGNLHGSIDDHDGMIGWIDNYCRAHPADPLFVAAADLVFDLRNNPRH